jgi:hypothetical protein
MNYWRYCLVATAMRGKLNISIPKSTLSAPKSPAQNRGVSHNRKRPAMKCVKLTCLLFWCDLLH